MICSIPWREKGDDRVKRGHDEKLGIFEIEAVPRLPLRDSSPRLAGMLAGRSRLGYTSSRDS
jgi:hypothetical protein